MAKKKKSGTPEGETMQKVLSITLEEAEKAERADLLADLQIEKTSVESEKREVSSKYRLRIKALTESINKLSRAVKNGFEERNVECTMIKNFSENRVEYWYKDQMLESRDMTADDRQAEMQIAEDEETHTPSRRRRSFTEMSQPPEREEDEVSEVIKMETSRKTKRSSIDGVYVGSRGQQDTDA